MSSNYYIMTKSIREKPNKSAKIVSREDSTYTWATTSSVVGVVAGVARSLMIVYSQISMVEVVELHCRPDLLESAARLLNDQWPRSLDARYIVAVWVLVSTIVYKHS